jgi:acyl-coenzyme A thioesterase PaaI-like protein
MASVGILSVFDSSTFNPLHGSSLSLSVTDFLSSSVGWPLTRLYAQYGVQDPPPGVVAPPLSKLFETLEFVTENRATCPITPSHASMGGPIHGGCQAILMELVATRYLQQQQQAQGEDSSNRPLILHSMDLEYLSKPSPKQVELTAQELLPHDYSSGTTTINFHKDATIVPVRVVLESKGRVNSYGVLRFVRSLP